MAEKTPAQRAKRRAYMKEYNERQRQIAELAELQNLTLEQAKEVWNKRAKEASMVNSKGGLPSVAEIMEGFQKISTVVQESGALQALFTWPDGSSITVNGDGSIARPRRRRA